MSKPVMISAVRSSDPSKTAKVVPVYLHNYSGGTFYTKTKDTHNIWIPIQPESCHSVFWDVYLPVFSLLELFDWQLKPFQLLLLDNSNCTSDQLMEYADMFDLSSNQIVTASQYSVLLNNETSQFVCFPNAVMGIGAHADHQVIRNLTNLSPKEIRSIPPNHMRRTDNLRGFRELCLKNLKLVPERSIPFILAYSSIFESSWIPSTLTEFEIVAFSHEYSLREQIQITIKSAVLILPTSHDKTAAFFLPEGSSLILIGEPREDWDLWTNYALIRVHLLSTITHEALEYLILDELHSLKSSTDHQSDSKSEPISFANDRFVKLIEAPPPSTRVHCIGEKVFPNNMGAYQYRSCHFENLCFDLQSKEFVMFPSAMNSILMGFDKEYNETGLYFSSVPRKLIGSPQPNKLSQGVMSFALRVGDSDNVTSYYFLEGAWLSKKTFNVCNYGHILWDVWLPLYSLLKIFGLDKLKILITRYPSRSECPMTDGFLEKLFRVGNRTLSINDLDIDNRRSKYVCMEHTATGFGWLSDHGASEHGWKENDFKFPINLRRGSELKHMRKYMLENLDMNHQSKLDSPFVVTFSVHSSRDPERRLDFREEIKAVQQLSLHSKRKIVVQRVHMFSLFNITKQLELSVTTSIFISAAGGGTFPAFFLSRGASLILYGDKNQYLDFDLFNNYEQVRVHWMSLTTRKNDTGVLLNLIQDELEALSRRVYD